MFSGGYGEDDSDESSQLLPKSNQSYSYTTNRNANRASLASRISPVLRSNTLSRSNTPSRNSNSDRTKLVEEQDEEIADSNCVVTNVSANADELEDSGEGSQKQPLTRNFSFFGLSRRHKMILASGCLADFLSYLCLSLLAPFFPQEAAAKNVNDTISGWIFGVFALSQVIFSPLFGKVLPVVGIKFMYLAGLFLSGGCTILFGFMADVNTENDNALTFIALCFTLRIFLSVGCTSLNTAIFALMAKEFPDNITTVFGIGEIFVGIGFMSGPAVGGVLYGFGGFIMPFLVIGGLMLVCVPINFWLLPADQALEQTESSVSSKGLFKSPTVIINCFSIVVASLIWSILDPTLEPHLREFNLGPETVGLLFLLMSAFYAIFSPIWGWIADKMTDNRLLLIPGFFFSAGGLLVLGPSTLIGFPDGYNELWLNIVALIFLGISASLALIPTFDIFLDVADELGYEEDMNMYGMVAGLFGSMYALGDFIGPTIGGFLLDAVGFQWCCTYIAFACFAMVPLLFFNWLYDHFKRKKVIKEERTKLSRENGRLSQTPLDSERGPLVDSWEYDNQGSGDFLSSYPPRNQTEAV